MSIQCSDRLGMEGELSVFIKPEGLEETFLYYRGRNRITNNARKHLLAMVVDPNVLTRPSPNPIVSFKVGEGGVGQVPDGTETDLWSALDPDDLSFPYLNAVTYSYTDSPLDMIAEYVFEISAADLDGKSISEVGLFCETNWDGSPASTDHMFNIKAFPPVSKTTSFALIFVWRINFSGAC